MLGSSCSPCCGICKLYEPPDEVSVYVVLPYVPSWTGQWQGRLGSNDFIPVGIGPVNVGGNVTLSSFSRSGYSYAYNYVRNDYYSVNPSLVQFGQEDPQLYNQWSSQSVRPPVYLLDTVARSFYVEVRLYPLGATENSPPKTIATDEDPPTFGRAGDFCGLAEFSYVEIASFRWSNGLVSSHLFEMYPQGKLINTTAHSNPSLPPVWKGGGFAPYTGSDGVDRTQYAKWTYDYADLLPTGDIRIRPGVKQPLVDVNFNVAYRARVDRFESSGDGIFSITS